ncbi:dTMP kinase [Caldalkalibacillus mannanilyticus]|uniref:dTMP kinase n=1 Tax=Caldalkalibacillus mannanilyticus TaxID=1418 RepID=UPI00046A5700|nr:dTMP kinase [Caldalkalibacillus mannanilyticus]
MNGLFITFEGPDGSGKSTQLQRLVEFLQERNIDFIKTREPGGTTISDLIRQIILDPEHTKMASKTEILLYAASRAQHVEEVIKPALQLGKVVVCDRFVDASIAYQGYGLGFGEEMIQEINRFATGGLTPDRTFLIDVSPEIGRERMKARNAQEFNQSLDRIEQKELDYHQRVRQGFLALAKSEARIKLVNGAESIEMIQELIREDIQQLLRNR